MMVSMPTLASPSNPRIRAAAQLRDRRERSSTGLTLVDGAREVRRALDSGVEVVEAFVCEPLLAGADARAALDQLRDRGIPVTTTSEPAFAKIAFGERAEGLVLVVRTPTFDLDSLAPADPPFVVVIEGVEKPGNLGAILRTADGAGVDALIAASPRTDLANPNVIRASAGTAFSVPMAAAPTAEVIDWLASGGIRIVAARVDAERPYADADLTGPLAIALGSEADGLSDAWRRAGIEAVRVPMAGVADSLNVSVTAAVLLYEARRQRDRRADRPD
jgi:RNA methyltransferase, TrmH family